MKNLYSRPIRSLRSMCFTLPIAGLVSSALLVSASAQQSAPSLVVAAASLPTMFVRDGRASNGYENMEFVRNTNAGLIREKIIPDPKNPALLVQDPYQFEPLLASSYEVSADGLKYTFRLRKGVKSAAGNPLTADDVIWSWQRKFKSTSSVPPTQSPVITDVDKQLKKVDESTVSFTIAKPGYGLTLLSLLAGTTGWIYDSVLLKSHVTAQDPYAIDWSVENPNISYGAYTRSSYTPGSEMVYSANPNYPLPAPYYKKITVRVTSEPGNRANAVRTGAADLAQHLSPADQVDLAAARNVKVYSFPSTTQTVYLTMLTTKAPLNDVRVRKALSHAVPYDQIIENVYRGRAKKTTGWLDPTFPNYDASGIAQPTYNPALAKRLLSEAGFPKGLSFTLNVSTSLPDVLEAAVQIQSFAADAGFDIKISPVPPAALNQAIVGRTLDAYLARDQVVSSSPQYILSLFYKVDAEGKPTATNSAAWVDQRYLAAVTQGSALPDPTSKEANTYWNTAQRISSEALPMIMVARVQPLNAWNARIVGYTNRLDNLIDFSMLKAAGM